MRTILLCIAFGFILFVVPVNSTGHWIESGYLSGFVFDSGDHVLMDGWEYTCIHVLCSVIEGDPNGDYMSSTASIRLGNGVSVYLRVRDKEEDDNEKRKEDRFNGLGDDSLHWYWQIDTRGNSGRGRAWLDWSWANFE